MSKKSLVKLLFLLIAIMFLFPWIIAVLALSVLGFIIDDEDEEAVMGAFLPITLSIGNPYWLPL